MQYAEIILHVRRHLVVPVVALVPPPPPPFTFTQLVDVENEIELIALANITLSLNTKNLKLQLKHEGSQWKVLYSTTFTTKHADRCRHCLIT